jgi:hypothetical protein
MINDMMVCLDGSAADELRLAAAVDIESSSSTTTSAPPSNAPDWARRHPAGGVYSAISPVN